MAKSYLSRLGHIIESIEQIHALTQGKQVSDIEADRISRRVIEREFEIISEASRHLPESLKARHPDIPWKDIAGIGNVLRHDYDDVAIQILWDTAGEKLTALEEVCRLEFEREQQRDHSRTLFEDRSQGRKLKPDGKG